MRKLVITFWLSIAIFSGILSTIGKNCYQDKDPDLSIRVCSQIIERRTWYWYLYAINNAIAYAYNSRGLAFDKKGEVNLALSDYDDAIRYDSKLAAAYNNRGIIYHSKGEEDSALADYNEAIRLDSKLATAYNNRGNVYHSKGEEDHAISDYDEAIRLDPKNALPFDNRGNFYFNKGDYDRALIDYNEAIHLDSKFANAYVSRGNFYYKKSEYDRALADYDEAIRLDPKNSSAYYNRGNVYQYKGEKTKALNDYAEAIRLDQKYLAFFNNSGAAKYKKSDKETSITNIPQDSKLKDDIYAALFRYLTRALDGKSAGAELEANAGRLKTKEWPYAVIELYLGKRSVAATLDAASKPNERCQAQFYIGQWHVLKGNTADAKAAFDIAVDTCPKTFIEFTAATAELKRLKP